MSKAALFLGTSNMAKAAFFKSCMDELSVRTVSTADLGVNLTVDETGNSPEANALIKAKAYYEVSRLPTLAEDSGLFFEATPELHQPGILVKRSLPPESGASDEILLDYYAKLLSRAASEVAAVWLIGLAITLSPGRSKSTSIRLRSKFVKTPSSIMVPGMPLLSLQVDEQGNYLSETLTTSPIVHKLKADVAHFVKQSLQLQP